MYKDFEPVFHPRIKVIPFYKHETLPTLLKDHHIHLFPSLCEGFGCALIEAMACGLAPITTDADGPMDIVRANHDALVVPRRNADAIEEAIKKLINNRVLLSTIRENAHETAQQYSLRSVAKSKLTAYQNILRA